MHRLGGLCHGRARRPLEPLGWVAPLVRTLAWGLSFVASLVMLLSAGLYAAGVKGPVLFWMFFCSFGSIAVAASLRITAGSFRAEPLLLPVRTPRP